MQHHYENPFTILFLDQLINDNILHLYHITSLCDILRWNLMKRDKDLVRI